MEVSQAPLQGNKTQGEYNTPFPALLISIGYSSLHLHRKLSHTEPDQWSLLSLRLGGTLQAFQHEFCSDLAGGAVRDWTWNLLHPKQEWLRHWAMPLYLVVLKAGHAVSKSSFLQQDWLTCKHLEPEPPRPYKQTPVLLTYTSWGNGCNKNWECVLQGREKIVECKLQHSNIINWSHVCLGWLFLKERHSQAILLCKREGRERDIMKAALKNPFNTILNINTLVTYANLFGFLYCELFPRVQFLKGSGLTVRQLKPMSNRHLVLLIKYFKYLKMIPQYKNQQ